MHASVLVVSLVMSVMSVGAEQLLNDTMIVETGEQTAFPWWLPIYVAVGIGLLAASIAWPLHDIYKAKKFPRFNIRFETKQREVTSTKGPPTVNGHLSSDVKSDRKQPKTADPIEKTPPIDVSI